MGEWNAYNWCRSGNKYGLRNENRRYVSIIEKVGVI